MKYPNSLIQLIRELSRLPGVGPKSAQRLAFHLFASPQEDVESLAAALLEAKRELHLCPTCFNITDELNQAVGVFHAMFNAFLAFRRGCP